MMTTSEFNAVIREEAGSPVVELCGEINAFAEDALNAAYSRAEAFGGSAIGFDFGKVEYINSTGIALIVGLLARARASKRSIVATGLSDHYREIFTITRLSDFMEMQ